MTAAAMAQTWTPLKGGPNISAYNATLLYDGSVIVQDGDNSNWWKLTPNKQGSYLNGTWKQLASTPGYGPLYYASSVLPDGRFFTMGGEYNFGTSSFQNQGFIYDPNADSWTKVNAPSGWSQMGDTGSIMLPNGKLMLCNPLSNQSCIFDPVTSTFGSPFSGGKADANDEEGLCLLPNGKVLTVDAVNTPRSELFDPKTGTWSDAGSTINSLVGAGEEIGPMVLRPDGTVICFGGGAFNSIYNTNTSTWSAAPAFPTGLDCADAPACLLPNGNVIVEASPGLFQSGAQFFEWNGTALTAVTGVPNAANFTSFTGGFLMLPTGEVLYTNQNPQMFLYTTKGTFQQSWAPTITASPSSVRSGSSYVLSGTQLTGLSTSSAYGDDEQNFTNYPMVRITNTQSGDVQYCRISQPSTYAVATGSLVQNVIFTVPNSAELGASTIQVVTNGIPSASVQIIVGPSTPANGVSTFQGTFVSGTLASVLTAGDGNTYNVKSVSTAAGQTCSVEADFNLASTQIPSITVSGSAAAVSGVTGQLFLYDFKANAFVNLTAVALGTGQKTFQATTNVNASRFVGPNGLVRVIVRGLGPARLNSNPFILAVDAVGVAG